MKLTKAKVIGVLAVVAVLAFAFWFGGSAPGLQGWTARPPAAASAPAPTPRPEPTPAPAVTPSPAPTAPAEPSPPEETAAPTPAPTPEPRPGGTEGPLTADEKVALADQLAGGSSAGVERGDANYSALQGMRLDPVTGKDQYLTDPVPEGKPLPVEPEDAVFSDVAYTCTLSVRCDTILEHMDWLDPEKAELVPADGVIFPATQVTFYEGESVFTVLQREMKRAKIHMEFVDTPIYHSAYIEGINNLYEFDCGELSGWMYKVNDWFPNYGCSRYGLKDGDVVEWVYTCDLGVDVGGYAAAAG